MSDALQASTTRWTVTVSKETDLALRTYLGSRGMRKGDISKFIEDAVRWRMFDQHVQQAREGFVDLDCEQAQALVDEAIVAARAGLWPQGERNGS